MEYEKKYYSITEFILLVFSAILQLVCLTTPGWVIRVINSGNIYSGIFYVTGCIKLADGRQDCKTISWLDRFKESILSHEDYTYNYRVKEQIVVMVCFAITIGCLILKVYQLRRTNHGLLLVTAITSCCLAFAGALMISHLSVYYIRNNYFREHSKDDTTESMGFPYCVLMYTVAFVSIVVTILLNMIQIYKLQQKPQIQEQPIGTEGITLI